MNLIGNHCAGFPHVNCVGKIATRYLDGDPEDGGQAIGEND
jgi:hypothetical protein